jgi:hypothetical protein
MSFDISSFNIEDYIPYVEREIWSPRYFRWHRYEVRRPRLPGPKDKKRWVDRHRPGAFQTYTGRDNETIRKGFNLILENFEANNKFPPVVAVHGPGGSGKSSFCLSLLTAIANAAGVDKASENKFIYRASCSGLKGAQIEALFAKIQQFGNAREDKSIMLNFRIVFLDDFDMISTASQMNFKGIMETLANKLRFIFVTKHLGKLAGFIQGRLVPSHTYNVNTIQPVHALTILLNIVYKNKCGYNRDGLHELFKQNRDMNLSRIIDDAQELFMTKNYISKEYVLRLIATRNQIKPEKTIIKAWAAIEPVARCNICTLYPPCKHNTEDSLIIRSDTVRKNLPSYKGGMICPEFARVGHCSMFNTTGHCSLSHPLKMHRIVKPKDRCPQCTLVWPCNHCSYTEQRNFFISRLEDITARLSRLRKLISPNPPGNMLIPISKRWPEWKDDVKEMARLCLGEEIEEFLKESKIWLDTTISIDVDVYRKKDKLVRFAFMPVLDSPILVDTAELATMGEDDEDVEEKELLDIHGGEHNYEN